MPPRTLTVFTLGSIAFLALFSACDEAPPAEDPSPIGTKTCTAIGCTDTFVATLPGFVAVHANELPLSIEACVDGQCVTGAVVISGTSSICASAPGTTCCALGEDPDASCFVDEDGELELIIPLPDGSNVGAMQNLELTIHNAEGDTLLDDSASDALTAYHPNGLGCAPTCLTAHVEFD